LSQYLNLELILAEGNKLSGQRAIITEPGTQVFRHLHQDAAMRWLPIDYLKNRTTIRL
jgi:hypothetical protein